MGLWAELRRRNVIRMAGLYLVGGWLVVQVAETLLPIFGTPDWVLKALVVLLALGFVPTLAFAWVFELTPDGLKREHDVARDASIVDRTARKLDIAVIVMLAGVGALLLWQRFDAPTTEAGAPATESAGPATTTAGRAATAADATTDGAGTAAATTVSDKSIAVLPFADFSPGGDQGWFADGLTDEILNSLARTPDLRVSARTSSFAYKASPLPIPKIAAELGVAHILEGSVRSTAERIRVTAQLVRAADGFHVWSQTYDRPVADMIAIQEDLATEIATAMQTSMDPEALAAMARTGTRSVEAYQEYLRGVALESSEAPADVRASNAHFERARELDPTFAAAHAKAAVFWINQLDPTSTQSGLSDLPTRELSAKLLERIDAAIAHAGSEIQRTGYRAFRAAYDLRLRESAALYRTYLAERPGDAEAMVQAIQVAMMLDDNARMVELLEMAWPNVHTDLNMALNHVNYAHRTGETRAAAAQARILLERWPTHSAVLYQVHRALLWDGQVDEARTVLERMVALPNYTVEWSAIPPARQACAEGRRAEVERALAELPPGDVSQRWHLLMLLGRHDEAEAALMAFENVGDTYGLAGFLTYRQFDPSPYPSLMRIREREGVPPRVVVPIPFACP